MTTLRGWKMMIDRTKWFSEKSKAFTTFLDDVVSGKADIEVIRPVTALFTIPWLCPTSSCSGHGGSEPGYINLETQNPIGMPLASLIPSIIKVPGVMRVDESYAMIDGNQEMWYVISFDSNALPEVLDEVVRIIKGVNW